MPIEKDLLDLMVCPACHGKLVEKSDASGLKCDACKRVYPIIDQIPCVIVDKAQIEDEPFPS
jgi:uncharacterized protein YbaR (Trm112 family)